jgi:glycosyltransferase involved in cell wall biosynthesis
VKIVLLSASTPTFEDGHQHVLVGLTEILRTHGHQVEAVYLPFEEDPETILDQMLCFRLVDLTTSADRVITFRSPAHMVRHPNKTVWFMDHIRSFYDLWNSSECSVPDTPHWRSVRARLIHADKVALQEARAVFAASRILQTRLQHFNSVESQVLYPPVLRSGQFHSSGYGDEIVVLCGGMHPTRQKLLLEAMGHVTTPIRLCLCDAQTDYAPEVMAAAAQLPPGRVQFAPRWLSEQTKIDRLAQALAVAHFPHNEANCSYSVLEAAHASKACIAPTDGGGLLEFVVNGENGLVIAPQPRAIAHAFDMLWNDRALAHRLGAASRLRVGVCDISWSAVLRNLLA